jgi:hypothetical protein
VPVRVAGSGGGLGSAGGLANNGLPAGVAVPAWAKGQRIQLFPSAELAHEAVTKSASSLRVDMSPGTLANVTAATSPPSAGTPFTGRQAATNDQGKLARSSQGAASPYLLGRRCGFRYCPNVPVYYYGGKIQTEPVVHVILWGRNWITEPGKEQMNYIMKFFESLSRSPWQGILTQYFQVNEGKIAYISHNVRVEKPFVDEREAAPGEAAGTEVNGARIKEEVKYAITHQPAEHPWARGVNAQFVVIPAPGAKYERAFWGSETFCAYHGDVSEEGATSTFAFAPYVGEEPFYHLCIEYDDHGIADHVTSMLTSHEYAETASDPELNSWLDTELFEIGDICSIVPGTNEVAGAWVQGLWDDHQNACSLGDESPPHLIAITEAATQIGKQEATLNGVIYPEGLKTEYDFEYGTTTAYGSRVPASATASAGEGLGKTGISQPVSGLQPGTTYHYRLVATNSSGTMAGEDRTFGLRRGASKHSSGGLGPAAGRSP